MSVQILPDRLERFLKPEFKLRSGTGKGVNSHVDVCVMQAVSWLAGEAEFTDSPDCVPVTIRRYLIRLNDSWLFSKNRDDLKPYAPRIIGLDNSLESERRRGFIAADYAVRVFLPLWLRRAKLDDEAAEFEAMNPIVSAEGARAGATAATRARRAAYAAEYAATDAAEYATTDATAATDAAATAAAAAAAAAYTDATAATDAALYAAAATDAALYATTDATAATAATAAAYAYTDADVAAAAAASFCASLRSAGFRCLDAMIAVGVPS